MTSKRLLREFVLEHLIEQVRKKFHMALPDDLLNLASEFKSAGHQLYVVGGSVRDALQGKEPKDYDVATDARPDRVIQILRNIQGYKVLEVGKAFGVVNAITPEGNEYEIATFRKDIGKGRRPDDVEFSNIETDVLRRDLTINALFYDIDLGEIVDFVGGIEDIKNGVVKAVGDPTERFDEDRLRILRALRFAGRMGSKLDAATSAAIEQDNTLEGVSSNRIRDEFIKSVKSAKSTPVLLAMYEQYGLFSEAFPGLKVSGDISSIDSNNPIVVLAMMFDGQDPMFVMKRLNALSYTGEEANGASFLLRFGELAPQTAYKLRKQSIATHIDDEDLIEYAHVSGNPSEKLLTAFIEYQPSVTGQELMSAGFTGQALGRELEKLEALNFQKLLGH